MSLRPLVIDDEAKAKVRAVLEYAERNHYHPRRQSQPPGNDPHFVAHLSTYRCVFTFTHSDNTVWRHLSISVPGEKYPNPAAAIAIADLFGFTGWNGKTIDRLPDGWMAMPKEDEHCIVLVQDLRARMKGAK